MKKYFVAGTDTEVGKTYVMQALLSHINQLDKLCYGLKPVASECHTKDGCLYNSDALAINKLNPTPLPYSQVNPYAFAPAIAPHIAAHQENICLSVADLQAKVEYPEADICLIEGAGGWLTPLNDKETFADWVELNRHQVILVVSMKLGCLNHAMLTVRDIQRRGLTLAGWIANSPEKQMSHYKENIQWLRQAIKEPMLGEIPYCSQPNVQSTTNLSLKTII